MFSRFPTAAAMLTAMKYGMFIGDRRDLDETEIEAIKAAGPKGVSDVRRRG